VLPGPALMQSVVAVLAADGRVGLRERRFLESLRMRLGVAPGVVEAAILEAPRGTVRIQIPETPDDRDAFLGLLVEAAAVDGVIAPDERRLLEIVAARMRLAFDDLDARIEAALDRAAPRVERKPFDETDFPPA
jgi:hypothetical protein